MKRHLALANSNFKKLMPIWRNKNSSTTLKIRLFKLLITPIVIYPSESWTLKTEGQYHHVAFETKSIRRIAGTIYPDRICNTKYLYNLKVKITILDRIKLQKLRWLGHIKHMESPRLPTIVFEGSVHGSRPRRCPSPRDGQTTSG